MGKALADASRQKDNKMVRLKEGPVKCSDHTVRIILVEDVGTPVAIRAVTNFLRWDFCRLGILSRCANTDRNVPDRFRSLILCGTALMVVCAWSTTLRDRGYQADNLGGQPQFHLLWLEALGRIFAEESSYEFVDQARFIVRSHDYRCVEPQ